MNLEAYEDRYPEGPKSCLHCKHFKTKIPTKAVKTRNEKPVNDKKILVSKMKPARCVKGLLLREKGGRGEIYRPKYPSNKVFWKRIKDGWHHHDWKFANLCSEFADMRDDLGEITGAWIDEAGEIDKAIFDALI